MNLAISAMYANGYWLERNLAKSISEQLIFFQKAYAACARMAVESGKRRFAMIPKCHFLHHTAIMLKSQAGRAPWAQNPLGFSVQIQEDFIGRPSRVSRRVDVRQIHRSTLNRCLILALQALTKSDKDKRGLI